MKQVDDCLRRLKTEQFTVAGRLRYLKDSIAEIREKRREEGTAFQVNVPDYTEKVQMIMRQVQLEVAGRPDGGTREIIKKMYVLEDRARRDARAEGPFESAADNEHHRRVQALLDVARNVAYYRIKAGDNCASVIPQDSFSRKGSEELFRGVKRNQISAVMDLLADDRFLVYQHNELRQTPLHVAAKRNLYDIVTLLIRHHSDVNAKDSMGKTPLYYSVLNCYREMTTLLIANMSSCFTSDA